MEEVLHFISESRICRCQKGEILMISTHLLFEEFNNRGMNAPEFIYSILYGKHVNMRGRTVNHPEKIINGIGIDKAIPTESINELNNIQEIELRSSCQGDSLEKPTFIIFRFRNNPNQDYINQFCKKINDGKYYCGSNLGRQGFYRVGITGKLYYTDESEKEFEKWWMELPDKIQQSF